LNVVRTLFAGLCFHTAGAALQEQEQELELEPEPEPEPEHGPEPQPQQQQQQEYGPEPEPEPEQEEEEWRPKSDPRLARVVELEESGETESAARLLRTLLASLDPHRTKPKLHAHLAEVSADAFSV